MKTAATAALLLLAFPALAAQPEKASGSYVDLYYSNLEYTLSDDADSIGGDGDGGGIRFWLGNGIGLFTAEAQSNKLEGNIEGTSISADLRQLRAGLGYRLLNEPQRGAWLRAEYINLDTDLAVEGLGSANGETDGFGVHFGGHFGSGIFHGYGEIGVVDLDDEDGIEYRVGLSVQPSNIGGFIEYRKANLEVDDFDLDEDFEDLRIGLRLAF